MPTGRECVCCCEIDSVKGKMEESSNEIHTITDHEGFQPVCLDPWVLQTAFSVTDVVMGTQKKSLFMSKFTHIIMYTFFIIIYSVCSLSFYRRYRYIWHTAS